jgi:Holliday junction DNA helicase RuvB
MNFCKLFCSKLTKTCDDQLFEDIIGYDHIKRLFRMALESESTIHVLLTGPPASAKTMFLTSIMRQLKNSYLADGANSTQAGMIDYVFENRPRYLLVDEIDKMVPKDHALLLNLMDTGIVTGTKYGKPRLAQINTSVLQQALLSVRYVAWMLSELWAL